MGIDPRQQVVSPLRLVGKYRSFQPIQSSPALTEPLQVAKLLLGMIKDVISPKEVLYYSDSIDLAHCLSPKDSIKPG